MFSRKFIQDNPKDDRGDHERKGKYAAFRHGFPEPFVKHNQITDHEKNEVRKRAPAPEPPHADPLGVHAHQEFRYE